MVETSRALQVQDMPKAKYWASEKPPAIVVLGGSFCPPHAGHIAALEASRRAAERDRLNVVAGYFAVAHDAHIRGKLRGRGEESNFAFGVQDRLRMCNAAAASISWLRPMASAFGSAQACGAAMIEHNHAPNTRIVKVRDVNLLTIDGGETVSSTLIRRELREAKSVVTAIRRLDQKRVVLPTVAMVLERLLVQSDTQGDAGDGMQGPDAQNIDEARPFGSTRVEVVPVPPTTPTPGLVWPPTPEEEDSVHVFKGEWCTVVADEPETRHVASHACTIARTVTGSMHPRSQAAGCSNKDRQWPSITT